MITIEHLSHASSLLSDMAYPAADAAVALLTIYLVIRDKNTKPLPLASTLSHIASALLVVLAASHYAGSTLILNQAASFALPLLAAQPSGDIYFQLANALGIYRLLRGNSSPLTSALCVLLHIFLVLCNLDLSSQKQVKSLIADISFSQVRQLGILRKLRQLTIDDLWPVPERLQLRNAYAEFKVDTNESMFLVRAIVRMIWKPMIPIQIARMLFQLLPIFKTMLNGYIYHCLDSPDTAIYYKAYVAAAGLLLAEIFSIQRLHLNDYINQEKSRVNNTLLLEMTRLPLIHSGLKSQSSPWHTYLAKDLVDEIMLAQDAATSLFGALATVLPLYRQVGWYAVIPLAVSLGISLLERILALTVGTAYDWDPTTSYHDGDTVEEIYFSTKTVKMFGWENMYLDPKLMRHPTSARRLPRYAPLMRFALKMVSVGISLTTNLSMYLTVFLYLRTVTQAMTNSQLLEMTEHVESLRWMIYAVFWRISRTSKLIQCNNDLEPLFRREAFATIDHESTGSESSSIHLDDCNFRWTKRDDVLKNVSLNINAGELVAVIGKTGSGKSSLLLALCKELEMTKGAGKVVGKIGYMEQSPWIMNDTLRANILFGREFDEEYFWKVIHACALTQDLESWPDSDLTLIGERGINISGGQRARLALARTVYSQADVYILDDPLSAVDAHVKRHILDNVILSSELLGDKLRVVTTHSGAMLPFCNQVVRVSDNTVSVAHQNPKEHQIIAPTVELDDTCDPTLTETGFDSTPSTPATNDDTQENTAEDAPESLESDEDELPPEKRTLMDNAMYAVKACGWHVIIAVVISASFSPITKYILNRYNTAALMENAKSNSVSHEAVLWYLRICLLKTATSEILDLLEDYITKNLSSQNLRGIIQAKFVRSMLHAPLALLERTDRHQIDSVYSDGSSALAYGIPSYLRSESANALESALSIWRSALVTPQLMLIVPLVFWARKMTEAFTSATSESLRKIKKRTSSKHSQTSSIIKDGGLMIRLFGVESFYMSRYMSDKDEATKVSISQRSLRQLSYMASLAIGHAGKLLSLLSAIVQSHLTRHKVNSGQMNMLRDDVAALIYNIGKLIQMPGRLEEFSNDISRFRQYSDLEAEAPYIVDDCRVPSEWPHSGNVEFKNLSVKYGANMDYALKNLNLTIHPGEKIGIVGRTGAGKSTLAKVLFRLLNKNVEGSIEIDGRDTATFGVGDFRPKLGIIPQESIMFDGTVRRNLDPLNEFTIEDMWAAMIKCGVAELIDPYRKRKRAQLAIKATNPSADECIADEDAASKSERLRWKNAGLLTRAVLYLFSKKPERYAANWDNKCGINGSICAESSGFSNGQQQLFSLCRLVMRKRKVMILDEATADVDLETDHKMQELIRSEFSDCTVLTIAHRLDTIMKSDRIIVMEKGEIAEIGSPQELISNGGKFAELVQANEF